MTACYCHALHDGVLLPQLYARKLGACLLEATDSEPCSATDDMHRLAPSLSQQAASWSARDVLVCNSVRVTDGRQGCVQLECHEQAHFQ